MSYKVNAIQKNEGFQVVNEARLVSTNMFRDIGFRSILGFGRLNKHGSSMDKNKNSFVAMFAAIILAFISAVTVSAISSNDQSDNSNHTGANGTGQQASGSESGNSDADRSQSENNSDSHASNSSSTSITVDGQRVDIPQNGSYDTTKDGVRISGQNSQSSSSSGGSVSNNSSTSVNIQSQ